MKKLYLLLLICLSSCAKDDIFIDITPISKQLYSTDGTLFANSYNRVINGKYGNELCRMCNGSGDVKLIFSTTLNRSKIDQKIR